MKQLNINLVSRVRNYLICSQVVANLESWSGLDRLETFGQRLVALFFYVKRKIYLREKSGGKNLKER